MSKIKRNKRGKESDRILLEVIKDNPGLSQYELAMKLKWNSGHVDSAIRRLLGTNKIFLKVMERNGRKVNLTYPIDYEKPVDVVEVPVQMLEIGNPSWSEEAFIYALDSSTIGISGSSIEEWEEVSAFKSQISPRREGEKMYFTIPESFVKFYNLDRKVYSTGVNGSNIFITVLGEVVRTKRYPA